MSESQPPIRLSRDVWSMISHAASTDKVYVVTMRNETSTQYTSEIGVFQNKQEAYKIACNVMGNYYLGCCIDGGHVRGFNRLYKFMYFQVMPDNSVFKVQDDETVQYPKDYIELYGMIRTLSKSAGLNPKTYVDIVEKDVI